MLLILSLAFFIAAVIVFFKILSISYQIYDVKEIQFILPHFFYLEKYRNAFNKVVFCLSHNKISEEIYLYRKNKKNILFLLTKNGNIIEKKNSFFPFFSFRKKIIININLKVIEEKNITEGELINIFRNFFFNFYKK